MSKHPGNPFISKKRHRIISWIKRCDISARPQKSGKKTALFITQADQKMNSFTLQSIVDEAPVVAIVRRPKVDPIRCIEHLFEAGIRMVEITMDTTGAVEALDSLRSALPSGVLLGAGTVTDVPRAEAALSAGASF